VARRGLRGKTGRRGPKGSAGSASNHTSWSSCPRRWSRSSRNYRAVDAHRPDSSTTRPPCLWLRAGITGTPGPAQDETHPSLTPGHASLGLRTCATAVFQAFACCHASNPATAIWSVMSTSFSKRRTRVCSAANESSQRQEPIRQRTTGILIAIHIEIAGLQCWEKAGV
jgi:hypothetical protein